MKTRTIILAAIAVMAVLPALNWALGIHAQLKATGDRTNCGLNYRMLAEIRAELAEDGEAPDPEALRQEAERREGMFHRISGGKSFTGRLCFTGRLHINGHEGAVLAYDCEDMHPGYRHLLMEDGSILMMKEAEFNSRRHSCAEGTAADSASTTK